ncbi:MAG: hypothetical protein JSS02_34965 [Planctomycetes bacterium]|nr:hypothetical protein [Planctomycetota bacterium]
MEKQNSLENAEGNGALAEAQPLSKQERRKLARRERKLIRKARERGVVMSAADAGNVT